MKINIPEYWKIFSIFRHKFLIFEIHGFWNLIQLIQLMSKIPKYYGNRWLNSRVFRPQCWTSTHQCTNWMFCLLNGMDPLLSFFSSWSPFPSSDLALMQCQFKPIKVLWKVGVLHLVSKLKSQYLHLRYPKIGIHHLSMA